MTAEAPLRDAVRLAPDQPWPAIALAEFLVATERAPEAVTLLARFIARPDADIFVLTAAAGALKAAGRLDEAAVIYARARDANPRSAVAEHNLAGVHGDRQRHDLAEAGTRAAFAKGLDVPDTWLVRARALAGLGRLDEAEAAYREVLRRRSTDPAAHGELAQLIWMRAEDAVAATATLDAALGSHAGSVELWLKRTQLAEYVAEPRAAYAVLARAPATVRATAVAQAVAAQLAGHFDPDAATRHAQAALAVAPELDLTLSAACQAALAAGDATTAARLALQMRLRWPDRQHPIAFLATAWRMLGDERYAPLYDYARFIRAQPLEAPPGWARLDAYLDDLTQALDASHRFRAHPIGQSLRFGGQSQLSLDHDSHPAIRAFPHAVKLAVDRYVAGLGVGDDPLRARITAGWAFSGVWSVRLRPGGFHVDHIHPLGWISSACHIVTPAALDRGREGWLKFGEPGLPTRPRLGPEHFVRPERGVLVLFPSYMWHGTVPFTGDDPRLSLAFDLVPA